MSSSSSTSPSATVTPVFPGAQPTPGANCPVCPTCFTCASEGCLNFGECQPTGTCKCPAGLAGKDCGLAACNSTNVLPELRSARPDRSECQCDDGFAGINCNQCLRDEACVSNAGVPMNERRDGDRRVCNRTPRVYKKHQMQCEINAPLVKGTFPDLMEVTLARNMDTKSGYASIWYKKVLQFSCQFSECTPSIQYENLDRKLPLADVWKCSKIQCKCIPRTAMCGGGGLLDLTPLISKVPGPLELNCPLLSGNGSVPLAKVSERQVNGRMVRDWADGAKCQFKLGGEFDALMQGGLPLENCLSGECAYAADAPLAISTGSGAGALLSQLSVGEMAGIGAVAVLVLAVLVALLCGKRQRDAYRRIPVPMPPAGMTYSVAHLDYQVGDKQVLSEVSAKFPAKTLTAIMGPSGAGKSGSITADFMLDGEPIRAGNKKLRHSIGFVDQEDTLWFVANTRLPESMMHVEKEKVVEQVLADLNIAHIRGTRIGGAGVFRGISGGERRRVSIACELVTHEPTSGLDSYNAHKLLESLATLAHKHSKTIICTIHQPRSDVYNLFDSVLLLARGRILYHGPAKAAQHYFARQGRPCPPQYNVADHLLDVAMDDAVQPMVGTVRDSLMVDAQTDAGLMLLSSGNAESDGRRVESPTAQDTTADNAERPQTMVWNVPVWDAADHAHESESVVTRVETVEMHAMTTGAATAGVSMAALANGGGESTARRRSVSSATSLSVVGGNGSATGSTTNLNSSSSSNNKTAPLPPSKSSTTAASVETYQVSYLTQVMQLLGRNARCLIRNPRLLIGHNVLAIVLGLVIGFLYKGTPMTIAGLQNRLGSVFFIQSLVAFSSLSALGGIAEERLLFMRERGNASYKPSAYFISKMMLDVVPLRILPIILMGSIAYFLIGFQLTVMHYIRYIAVLILFSAISALLCMAIGVLLRDVALANLVAAISTLFFMLFGGILINANAIAWYLRWIQYLSFFRWATEALAVNEIEGLIVEDKLSGIDVRVSGSLILEQVFGYQPGSYLRDLLVLVGIDVVLVVAVGVLIAWRLREVR
ncbi:ABC-2 type transporter-domain-containing protein [Catenaria anguillulae PL171]|uniref:ABC-2 type transporter-domain-containing protein n=1 Tax=Catenaria anguillulae PL171 TaxID=765915 RepID=A0A1Y2HQ71_9FUNG|nr:ABC-2 type transporter-domain-containing protein [Catenaria anguillulae PL171]